MDGRARDDDGDALGLDRGWCLGWCCALRIGVTALGESVNFRNFGTNPPSKAWTGAGAGAERCQTWNLSGRHPKGTLLYERGVFGSGRHWVGGGGALGGATTLEGLPGHSRWWGMLDEFLFFSYKSAAAWEAGKMASWRGPVVESGPAGCAGAGGAEVPRSVPVNDRQPPTCDLHSQPGPGLLAVTQASCLAKVACTCCWYKPA